MKYGNSPQKKNGRKKKGKKRIKRGLTRHPKGFPFPVASPGAHN